MNKDWQKEFPAAITICDEKGIIIYMNDKSKKSFANDGGEKLIGTNLLNCHPEPSKSMLKRMLEVHNVNSYTVEKNGVKKLIHQSPWFEAGEFKGYVEFSIEIPFSMEHFVREQ